MCSCLCMREKHTHPPYPYISIGLHILVAGVQTRQVLENLRSQVLEGTFQVIRSPVFMEVSPHSRLCVLGTQVGKRDRSPQPQC